MDNLSLFTLVLNFIAISISVWLGWYIITRSPRRLVSWLTSLTLWSLSGLFLNMLLAQNPPQIIDSSHALVQALFPFWSRDTIVNEGAWLTGWQATPAIAFWHHATMILRTSKQTIWQKVRVGLVYLMVVIAIYLQIRNPYTFTTEIRNPSLMNSLEPDFPYTFFMSLLFLFAFLGFENLITAARATPSSLARKQFKILAYATLIAGVTGPVSLISVSWLEIPRIINTILLGVPIGLIGYTVARYSALIEGRTIRRDFVYNATAIGLIVLVYSVVTWISVLIFDIPPAAYVFVILLAITTHSLIDFARRYLDSIFYRKEDFVLRKNLRMLSGHVGKQNLKETIDLVLSSVCDSVKATYGVVLLFKKKTQYPIASFQWQKDLAEIPFSSFQTDDLINLEPNPLPAPLNEAVLLIPLYAETEQIGAMIIGPPINSTEFSDNEVERFLEVSDSVADSVYSTQREDEYLTKAVKVAKSRQIRSLVSTDQISVKEVEGILRHIFDYAVLGESVFVELRVVRQRLSEDAVTHLDKGKIVYEVIEEVVNKLRPEDEYPGDPAPREWHQFLILYGAYFENKLNRDIMSQLYISEGTFNRTRRSAIRTISRALVEMEAAQI